MRQVLINHSYTPLKSNYVHGSWFLHEAQWLSVTSQSRQSVSVHTTFIFKVDVYFHQHILTVFLFVSFRIPEDLLVPTMLICAPLLVRGNWTNHGSVHGALKTQSTSGFTGRSKLKDRAVPMLEAVPSEPQRVSQDYRVAFCCSESASVSNMLGRI